MRPVLKKVFAFITVFTGRYFDPPELLKPRVTFPNMLFFCCEGLLRLPQTPELEDHPLPAVY